MSELPAGTVTFLFTDIEGSTRLLEQLGDEYAELLKDQRAILREVFKRWSGQEVDTQGDSFFYSFTRASDAINAAIEAQREVAEHEWPEGVNLPIRMGLHTGEPLNYEEGYVGMDVHRAARIAAAGHGGQILLSETTAPLILDSLQEGVSTVDLGRHRLKDMKRPERITQFVIEGLPSEFPPLNSLETLPSYDQASFQVSPPSFLSESEQGPPPPVFVARDNELSQLESDLDKASDGKGRVVFISGGPGRGKTALMEAFGRRVTESHSDVLVAMGSCSAYRGVGDPYQPFRQILSMLCGDVERAWTTGSMSREAALRLWEVMPATARKIVENDTDLLDTFVPAQSLSARIMSAIETRPTWIERLSHFAERKTVSSPEREKSTLFEQYESVLKSLCEEHTLLLMLDDLQWVDAASLDLLFHLGRCVGDHPILILGAYRPEEVALGRDGGPHPLDKVLAEFKRQFGDNVVDLADTSEIEARKFIDDLLDSEPNRLGVEFRSALLVHTSGHPLFTVESLRNLQEQGSLVRDQEGAWVDTMALDWSSFPARVEGVIEERIGRLGDDLKRILEIASVEGVVFTSHVVAAVEGIEERSLLRQLSQDLGQRHRLIQEHGILQIDGQRYFQYRFRHELFQQHLYTHIAAFERSALHKEVGDQLEGIYQDRSSEIAPQLAVHFDKAGDSDRALKYLVLAGDRARMIYANAVAIGYYLQALEVLQTSERINEKARLYMKLGLVYTASFQNEEASQAYDEAFELWDKIRESEKPAERVSSQNVLRMVINEPVSFDPGAYTDDSSRFILNQLYEGLTTVDDEFNVLPAAANRWEILDEGLRYIFYLRDSGYWSDGTRLQASDFENAWKRNIGLKTVQKTSSLFFPIKNARAFVEGEISDANEIGINTIDELTLEVCLESPTAYLPYVFSLPDTVPLHQFSLENEVDLLGASPPPISNGPFYLAEYTPGERLILRRNPFFQGVFPGNITEILCPFITDFEKTFDDYESNIIDAVDMSTLDMGTMARARSRFGEDFSFVPQLVTFYLTFRVDRPPFDDIRVRRAFAHAIDKASFSNEATKGAYTAADGGLIPPKMPGHSKSIGLEFDVELARKYLEKAGYPEGRGFPEVSLAHIVRTTDDPLVPFLLKSWREILRVEISSHPMEWADFLEKRYSDPSELMVSGWLADYPDPDSFLRPLFHGKEGMKPGRWSNQEFDLCIDRAVSSLDQNERLRLYRRADEILVAEATAIVPVYYSQGRMLAKPWVSMPRIPHAMLQLKEVEINLEGS